MAHWKTSVNPILLQQDDLYNQIWLYDTLTGKYQMKHRREIGDPVDLWRGFAKPNHPDLVGLFATDQGPVFFVNDQMYPLAGNGWDFTVEPDDEKTNIFRFVYNDATVYETKYKRVKELGVHPYADEEFMDFFTWMAGHKKRETFVQYYTTEI